MNAGGCASRRERDLYFWRDNVGTEVDVLIDGPQGLQALEIKLGGTLAIDRFDGKKRRKFAGSQSAQPSLVCGGRDWYERWLSRLG